MAAVAAEQDSVLIAVSVTRDQNAEWMVSLPQAAKVYELKCESLFSGANFRFKTSPVIGERQRQLEIFKKHGFTVIGLPKSRVRFASSDLDIRHEIIVAAMEHIIALYDGGKIVMTGYDEQFGRKVLEAVAARHPQRVDMMDIKQAMTPEPSDAELLTALDALSIDGYIEGPGIRESSSGRSKLAAMTSIISTKQGREYLKPTPLAPESSGISNLHFHAPVGAVGHNSVGTVTINQQWVAAALDPDWSAVSAAFKEAVAVKAKGASSSEDYLTIAALAKAQEEASQKNKAGFLDTVSKLGQSALPILTSAGAHGLVSYLEHRFGWKLN